MKNRISLCGAFLALGLLGSTPNLWAQDATAAPAVSGGARWGKDYFPNVLLTTQEGKEVRFFEDLIEDKVVVINFIYTTCPDTCPLETARLLEVYNILGNRVGSDVFFYSITIDPEIDTAEVLAEYKERYGIGEGWTFLTGAEADIIQLRRKLGLYIDEIQAEDSKDHNLSLIIGNQSTGRWMTRSPFDSADFLADQIGGWLHNWKRSEGGREGYENAPKLRTLSVGERLFRTRCAACHTIGGGDTRAIEERRVGPDLMGITEMRDHAWLARWIAEPEKVLAEKDPIAMGLFAKYNELPMPNMRLGEIEVESLLDYLKAESTRVDTERRIAALDPNGGCCDKEPSADEELPETLPETQTTTVEGGLSRTTMLLSGGLGAILLVMASLLRFRSTRM